MDDFSETVQAPAQGVLETELRRLPGRGRVAESVAHELRQAILQGKFPRDSRLVLGEIAKMLGVSVMPVREALIALADEDLVRQELNRGFFAKPPNEQDVRDIFEVEAQLSGMLAMRAAEVATPDDIERLRAIDREIAAVSLEDGGSPVLDRIYELNDEFHRTINRIAPGGKLRWFLSLASKFVRMDLYETLPGALEMSLAEHPGIIDAIAQGDGILARDLVVQHLRRGANARSQDR